jgi:hypothetical protein
VLIWLGRSVPSPAGPASFPTWAKTTVLGWASLPPTPAWARISSPTGPRLPRRGPPAHAPPAGPPGCFPQLGRCPRPGWARLLPPAKALAGRLWAGPRPDCLLPGRPFLGQRFLDQAGISNIPTGLPQRIIPAGPGRDCTVHDWINPPWAGIYSL